MDNANKRNIVALVVVFFLFGVALGYYLCKYGLRLPNLVFPPPTPTVSSLPTSSPKGTVFYVTPTPTSTPSPTFVPPGLEKK